MHSKERETRIRGQQEVMRANKNRDKIIFFYKNKKDRGPLVVQDRDHYQRSLSNTFGTAVRVNRVATPADYDDGNEKIRSQMQQ